jgi:phosphogluconate dehydratase
VRTGDTILLDSNRGLLHALVPESEWHTRIAASADLREHHHGLGRELFGVFRANALGAEQGAMTFVTPEDAESIPAHTTVPVHDHFVFAENGAK